MLLFYRRNLPDLLSLLLLTALCGLFFWRLLTPGALNQQSLVEGDFSGQFVAFAQYQAERFQAGEVPLWNPYSLGGHPFLADTQSAVFYPPRLITIALLNATGGSTPGRMYDALQKEMIFHTWLASLLMYAFVRRVTRADRFSFTAGLISGITFAYGGYLTGYLQLQLAVMETGIWLPLALVGIYQGVRGSWGWFALAGLALGLSLLAGHPQTTLFFGYTALGYLGAQVHARRAPWTRFILGAAILGLIGGGLAAVQLLPGWEYTQLTTRGALSFDAMGNGFPLYDVLQVFLPGLFSLWSPLYFGIAGLMLTLYAALRRPTGSRFWLVALVLALGLSFGSRTIIYDIVYNLVPGFSLFRGQERSAYVIALATSVLAGLGAAALLRDTQSRALPKSTLLLFGALAAPAFTLFAVLLPRWISAPAEVQQLGLITFGFFAALLAAGILILIGRRAHDAGSRPDWRVVALTGLIVLELFSFARMDSPNLEAKPATERLRPSAVIDALVSAPESASDIFRVDGLQAIGANYGSLYGIMDIEGISPLKLARIEQLLNLPNRWRAWEVLAVRYVPTPDQQLPVPSTIQKTFPTAGAAINLHRLDDPRPFARLVYQVWVQPDDDQARGTLNDPSFDSKHTVILPADPGVGLPAQAPTGAVAAVQHFAPEHVTLQTQSLTSGILDIALVYYPGWEAVIDDQPATLLRADTAMTALVVPAGNHTVQLTFAPRTYTVGALISLVTLFMLVILGVWSGFERVTGKSSRASRD